MVTLYKCWHFIGFGTYDSEDMKLGIFPIYSAKMKLKTGQMTRSMK